TCKTSRDERRHESDCEQHRRVHLKVTLPDGRNPVECLNRRWNRNEECCEGKHRSEEWVHTRHKHVVSPNDCRKECNSKDRHDHRAVSEDRLTRIGRHDFRYKTHRWKNYDVYLRVSEEPKKVLEQYRRSSLIVKNFSCDENI